MQNKELTFDANGAHPDWESVRSLFEQALAVPAAQRETWVKAQANTAPIAQDVLALLAHTTDARGSASGLEHFPSAHLNVDKREGQRLGPWQLVSELGAGGMGEVWLAERADGSYSGQAAVKLLKRGMDSASVLARFDLERQSLARLDHPNIARLLDAGLSPDGLPYFVMEHVPGLPIDQAAKPMSFTQRLALFLQLTDAVSHAHRNLLVHRDLKPSNVLLTNQGQVKLLDFGIAKALDAAANNPNATRQGDGVYTPSYASPEQVRGEPVSTATDIYSLGVLLYVLLTGVRPYARESTEAFEIAKAVLDDVPTKPSALSAQQTLLPNWEQSRQRLAGDLDNILLKALAKDIHERYASVDAFADDLRAHLANRPVRARAPSFGYVATKFVRRNRLAVGLAGLVGLAMVVGTAGIAWQVKIANEQRKLAEQRFDDVYQFARTTLFDVDLALRDGPTAGREKLVTTAQAYLEKLAADERLANNKPDLWRDIAEAYERIGDIQGGTQGANLGRPQDARRSYERAFVLRTKLAQAAPNDLRNLKGLLASNERMGDQLRVENKLQEALVRYQTATDLATKLATRQPDDLPAQVKRFESTRYLSSVYFRPFFASLGDYPRGKSLLEPLVPESEALLTRFPAELLALENRNSVLNQWLDQLRMEGRYSEMLAAAQQNEAVVRKLIALAPTNPKYQRFVGGTLARKAEALVETGDFNTAMSVWQQAVAQHESVAAGDAGNERAQRNVANALGGAAEYNALLGRNSQALMWSEREFTLLTAMRAQHPQVGFLIARLDEAAQDYAVQLAVNQLGDKALVIQRGIDSRQLSQLKDDHNDPDLAKFAVQRARTLLLAKAPHAQEAIAPAQHALSVLTKAAQARPYDHFRAREAAVAAHRLAVALMPIQPQAACKTAQDAIGQLQKLLNNPTPALTEISQAHTLLLARCGSA